MEPLCDKSFTEPHLPPTFRAVATSVHSGDGSVSRTLAPENKEVIRSEG